MTTIKVLAIGGLAVIALVASAACSSSGSKTVQGNLNLDPITALAGAARTDAQAMEQHATAMEAATAQRADRARWAADAATIRANARTLNYLADSAVAITRDPGSHPGDAVQLARVYGDGSNLRLLGQTLIDHAGAMTAHVAAMREQAAGDEAVLRVVDAFAPNVDAMKADGQAAIDRGTELMDEASRLANTVGVQLQ